MDALDIEKWAFIRDRYVSWNLLANASLFYSFHGILQTQLTVYYYFLLIYCSPGKSVAISSIILGTVMVGRAAFVFPLSFLSNLSKKYDHEKITFNQQVCSSSS